MIQSKLKKNKPILYDPLIIPRVKQYLEENVHQTYVDVAVMARQLQERYREYNRRKSGPFRQLVEQAYKTVLHSYGLDSNPSSDENEGGNSDLEMMEVNTNANNVNDMLTNMYSKNQTKTNNDQPGNDNELIDISSDESVSNFEDKTSKSQKKNQHAPFKSNAALTITKVKDKIATDSNTKENVVGPLLQQQLLNPCKKRKYTESHNTEIPKMPPLTTSTGAGDIGSNISLPPLRARRYKKTVHMKQAQYTFQNVGGMDRVLKELCEFLFHIKHPELSLEVGLSPPRGFLLHGPPGCGKSMLAQAIAGQLNIGIIEVPATELIAGVSGESEERIRDIFEQAVCCAPCVLFIDEIDAISSNRLNAQRDMERRIVAQLISSLDSLHKLDNGEQVIVIGATNRPEVLDPALRRVGRFDHELCLGIPDRKEREEILILVCETLTLEPLFDYRTVAELTPGYVGGDLLALATRAASIAVKRKYFSHMNKIRALKMGKNIPVVDLIDDGVAENEESSKQNEEKSDKKEEKQENEKKPDEEKDTEKVNEVTEEETAKENGEDGEGNKDTPDDATKPDEKESENTEKPKESDESETMEVDEKEKDKEENEPEAITADEPIDVDEISDTLDDSDVRPIKDPSLSELLSWLNSDTPPLQESQLTDLCITLEDFKQAIKVVQPSAKREGFITVPDVTWNDIGSLRDIREELQLSVLAPVKYPEKLNALGLNAPSGILLCGPPGCGKTLLAKAVANEAGINFISVKGPELMNMYVGESERAVRQCFQRARNSAPCVIFFDEFDSLCPKRSEVGEGGSGTRVVNQLLTEMDGIEERKGVYLMAATNRPDIIDPAILRPGRLDIVLYIGLPEEKDRIEILEAVTKNRTRPVLAEDVDLGEISKETDGFTGADLSGLIRQAALLCLKDSISNPQIKPEELKVNKEHLVNALKLVKPSVGSEERKMYEKLRIKYAAPRVGNESS